VGPTGAYNFDDKGDHAGDPEVFCVSPPPARATVSSGYTYKVKDGVSIGVTSNCP
jgi:hypothetical protein